MIIKVLILDDHKEWANDLKKSLERLDELFFNTLETDITKFTCIVATNTDEAYKIIKREEIGFITLDIKLAEKDEGDEFYKDVRQRGIFIPAIALSAEVKSPLQEKKILNNGVYKIISKSSSGSENVDIQVAKGICEVLEYPEIIYRKEIINIEHLGVFEHKFEYNDKQKTGKEWWNEITNKTVTKKDTKQIMDLMYKECVKRARYDQRSDHD